MTSNGLQKAQFAAGLRVRAKLYASRVGVSAGADRVKNLQFLESPQGYAEITAFHVVLDAVEDSGIGIVNVLDHPSSTRTALVLAFANYIGLCVANFLKDESLEVDLRGIQVFLGKTLLVTSKPEEVAVACANGAKALKDIMGSGHPGVERWAMDLNQLVWLFVIQVTSKDSAAKEKDLRPLFVGFLRNILSISE